MVMGMDSEAGRQLGNRRVPRSALSAILALKAGSCLRRLADIFCLRTLLTAGLGAGCTLASCPNFGVHLRPHQLDSGKTEFFWRWDAVSTEAAALFSKPIYDQFLCFRPLIFIFSFNWSLFSLFQGSAVMFAEHTPAPPRPGYVHRPTRGPVEPDTVALCRVRDKRPFPSDQLSFGWIAIEEHHPPDHANGRGRTRPTRIGTPDATTMRDGTPDSTIAAFR